MSNASQWVLVTRCAEVTCYSENAVCHHSVKVFDLRGGRERYQRGGAA
jgi:hypothetical protein